MYQRYTNDKNEISKSEIKIDNKIQIQLNQ